MPDPARAVEEVASTHVRRDTVPGPAEFVSRRVRSIPASGIRRFFDLIGSMEGVISLGVGEPDFVTPRQLTEAAIRSLNEGHTHYTSNYGLLELRQALSAHLERLYGVRYDPASARSSITAGVSEALQLAIHAALDPGDEVICPEPCFVAYQPCVTLAGGVCGARAHRAGERLPGPRPRPRGRRHPPHQGHPPRLPRTTPPAP